VGRPSAIAPLILDWLRTPGPDGQLWPWKVCELAQGIGCAWTTVAQQVAVLVEAGQVEHAGHTYAPRGVQPSLYRAVEVAEVVEGAHAAQGVHEVGRVEVAGGPSVGEPVDVHGRQRARP
jgi:hypothetical protein